MGATLCVIGFLLLLSAPAPARANCECLGNNDLIPKSQTKYKGTDYGKWCNEWDNTYNYCSAEKKQKEDRLCWCEAKWCYVSSSCSSALESIFSDETVMHFSYEACGEDFAHHPEGEDCWDHDAEVDFEDFHESDDVLIATRSKRSDEVKVLNLGNPEMQNWDFCFITSCMYYGAVEGQEFTTEEGSQKITLSDATLTSTHGDYAASRAIDGNYATWFGDGSCMHSGDAPAAWRASLGGPHSVTEVRIWSRRDCCHDRSNKLKIKIGDDVCVKKTSGARKGGPNIFHCEGPANGDFIEISSSEGGQPMNFCEVEVYGNMASEEATDATVSNGCRIVHEGPASKPIMQVQVQPYTVAIVRCLKGQAHKDLNWVSSGKPKKGNK